MRRTEMSYAEMVKDVAKGTKWVDKVVAGVPNGKRFTLKLLEGVAAYIKMNYSKDGNWSIDGAFRMWNYILDGAEKVKRA
jgi:hypothetical protein